MNELFYLKTPCPSYQIALTDSVFMQEKLALRV